MRCETVEEFLKRGGTINKFSTKEHDRASKYRKDTILKNLYRLRQRLSSAPDIDRVNFAIDRRIGELKKLR
jgi:hypothetical protein